MRRHVTIKNPVIPTPIIDIFKKSTIGIDTWVSDVFDLFSLGTMLSLSRFTKRSGYPIKTLIYVLILWPFLEVRSIYAFCRQHLEHFTTAKKDALYDVMARSDLSWRELHGRLCSLFIRRSISEKDLARAALVLDDTTKGKRGKKMEGVCYHHDHTTGKTISGYQALHLGLVHERGFYMLDCAIRLSNRLLRDRRQGHDNRDAGSRRWKEASRKTKIQQAIEMVNRAVQRGAKASYLLADSWFGCVEIINCALHHGLIPVLRMKRSKQYYLYDRKKYTAKELWHACDKRKLKKVSSLGIKALYLDVALPRVGPVRLFFVKGIDLNGKKKEWALFLSTDRSLSIEQMLEIYSWRWSIEVYFKEAKQYLGLLKEQVRSFEAVIASLHLAAIRHCFLSYIVAKSPHFSFGHVREQFSERLKLLTYGSMLWNFFRALIYDTLEGFKERIGQHLINEIFQEIELNVRFFLIDALQISTAYLQIESNIEKEVILYS
jgi:hypothetical protein